MPITGPKFAVKKSYTKYRKEETARALAPGKSGSVSYSYSCVQAFKKNQFIIKDLTAIHQDNKFQGIAYEPCLFTLSGERDKPVLPPFYYSNDHETSQSSMYSSSGHSCYKSEHSIDVSIGDEDEHSHQNIIQWLKYRFKNLNVLRPYFHYKNSFLLKRCKRDPKPKMELLVNNIDEQSIVKLKSYVNEMNLSIKEHTSLCNETVFEIDITPLLTDKEKCQQFITFLQVMDAKSCDSESKIEPNKKIFMTANNNFLREKVFEHFNLNNRNLHKYYKTDIQSTKCINCKGTTGPNFNKTKQLKSKHFFDSGSHAKEDETKLGRKMIEENYVLDHPVLLSMKKQSGVNCVELNNKHSCFKNAEGDQVKPLDTNQKHKMDMYNHKVIKSHKYTIGKNSRDNVNDKVKLNLDVESNKIPCNYFVRQSPSWNEGNGRCVKLCQSTNKDKHQQSVGANRDYLTAKGIPCRILFRQDYDDRNLYGKGDAKVCSSAISNTEYKSQCTDHKKVSVEDVEQLVCSIDFSSENNSSLSSSCNSTSSSDTKITNTNIKATDACFESLNYNLNPSSTVVTEPVSEALKLSITQSESSNSSNYTSCSFSSTLDESVLNCSKKPKQVINQNKTPNKRKDKSNMSSNIYFSDNSMKTINCESLRLKHPLKIKGTLINSSKPFPKQRKNFSKRSSKWDLSLVKIIYKHANSNATSKTVVQPYYMPEYCTKNDIFKKSSILRSSQRNSSESMKELESPRKSSINIKIKYNRKHDKQGKQQESNVKNNNIKKTLTKLKSFQPKYIYRSITSLCRRPDRLHKDLKDINEMDKCKQNPKEKYLQPEYLPNECNDHIASIASSKGTTANCPSETKIDAALVLNHFEKFYKELKNQKKEMNNIKDLIIDKLN